jgi:HK97 family phage prohead protease
LDRHGEVVRADGGTMVLPLPVLLQHDHQAIVGSLTSVESERLPSGERCLRGRLRLLPPGASSVADEAAALVEHGAIASVSIGFVARDEDIDEGPPRTYRRWELVEVSLVGIPACPNCLIERKALRRDADALPVADDVVRAMVSHAVQRAVRQAKTAMTGELD